VDFEKKRKLGFVEAVGCCLIKAIFFFVWKSNEIMGNLLPRRVA